LRVLFPPEHEPETREALDVIFSDHFNRDEPGIFAPIRDMLLARGDYYMHLADLASYAEAHARVAALYENRHVWAKKAILNVASSGRFSSDRTVAEYAADIWNVRPCPVRRTTSRSMQRSRTPAKRRAGYRG
jgi:starch phosphorylase